MTALHEVFDKLGASDEEIAQRLSPDLYGYFQMWVAELPEQPESPSLSEPPEDPEEI